MSDSDGETAFASADEGEDDVGKTRGKKSTPGDGKTVKDESKPAASGAKQSPGQAPSAKAGGGEDERAGKKGKGKDRRQNKPKQPGEKSAATSTENKAGTDVGATGDSTALAKKDSQKKTSDASKKSPTKPQSGKKETKSPKSKLVKENEPEKPSEVLAKGDQGSKKEDSKEVKTEGTPVPDAENSSGVSDTKADTDSKDASSSRDQTTGVTASPASQTIPRSPADQRSAASALDKLAEDESEKKANVHLDLVSGFLQSSGWGWGSWGSSLLNVATSSVSTFKHQVGEGFHTILETVETSLGAPDPEELARAEMATEPGDGGNGASHHASDEDEKEGMEESKKDVKKEEEKKCTDRGAAKSPDNKDGAEPKMAESSESTSQSSDNWFSSWGVSGITSKLQQKGRKLVSEGSSLVGGTLEMAESLAAGGIDALESLGKKTYSVLTDRDPRLARTRAFLSQRGEKPNLSELLREARDEAELKAQQDQEFEEARKAHFGALFDEFQGLAHLEALEMLSGQSEKKVQALLAAMSEENVATIKPELLAIKEVFEKHQEMEEEEVEEEEHDFARLVTEHLTELHLGTLPDKLNSVQDRNRKWIADFYTNEEEGQTTEPKEIHRMAISALAELTARSVEQFHKAGELILLQKDSDTPILNRTRSLSSLTKVLCTEIEMSSTKFCKCLNKVAERMENDDDINPLVTNTYLEASNSSAYIQDALQLLLPVLQHAAIMRAV